MRVAMTDVRDDLVRRLYRGDDPFVGFPAELYPLDKQGWQSEHRYLVQAVDEVLPRIVVEVGVWKGASVITLARRMKERRLDGVVIAIDTWLGSVENWLDDRWFPSLLLQHGRPQFHNTFMANIISEGLQDYVLPLPLDSLNAVQIVRHLKLSIDVMHLDAGHDYALVSADLREWWPLVRPGGILIGDDYSKRWPDVMKAFDELFPALEQHGGKCRVRKPLA